VLALISCVSIPSAIFYHFAANEYAKKLKEKEEIANA